MHRRCKETNVIKATKKRDHAKVRHTRRTRTEKANCLLSHFVYPSSPFGIHHIEIFPHIDAASVGTENNMPLRSSYSVLLCP